MKRIFAVCITIIAGLAINCSRLTDTSVDSASKESVDKCQACHAFPPTDNFHGVHTSKNFINKTFDCAVCHQGFDQDSGHPVTMPGHDNPSQTVNVVFDSLFGLDTSGAHFNNDSQSCSLVYCHGNIPDMVSAPIKVSNNPAGRCTVCHDTTSMFTLGHPRTDTVDWPRHTDVSVLRNCFNCHDGYNIDSQTVVDSTHINGRYDHIDINTCYQRMNGSGTIVGCHRL